MWRVREACVHVVSALIYFRCVETLIFLYFVRLLSIAINMELQ